MTGHATGFLKNAERHRLPEADTRIRGRPTWMETSFMMSSMASTADPEVRPPFRLDGRVALVTGAGSDRGIGREVARVYAAAGARVALADVDGEGARRNAREIGAAAVAVQMDVTEPDSVRTATQEARDRLGPIDILVNSAGMTRGAALWETPLELFDRIQAVNVRGGWLCLQAVTGDMRSRGWGRVVWLSSVAGKQGGGVFGSTAYATSKAAVIGLCQGAARELGPFGITSNAIAPGLVATGLVEAEVGRVRLDELAGRIVEATPTRRSSESRDIAAAALFLASEEARQVNGEILDVNGGFYFD